MSKDESTETETNSSSQTQDSNVKPKPKREKNAPPTKVVVRGLPPTMNQETFEEQVSPLPELDYLYFVRGDLSMGQFAFSRAYINFINQDDLFIFTEKFDGYVFVDSKGNEFTAMVEFAPFQKIPKRLPRKRDAKCGTIEKDPDYLKFLEQREKAAVEEQTPASSTQETLEEIEAKERELRANRGVSQTSTPLLDFIKQRKEDRIRFREEKKEERRRREAERRKMREDERRRIKETPASSSRDFHAKDKSKMDKTPKQVLTHKDKEKDAQSAVELTKKLKEVLKIDSEKMKKEGAAKDTPERSKDSYKDRSKDKYKQDRENKTSTWDKDRERVKGREEEKAHKQGRKSGAEKHEKRNSKPTESVKESKSYQSFREERRRELEARAAKAKHAGDSAQKEPATGAKVEDIPTSIESKSSKDLPLKKTSGDKGDPKEKQASEVSDIHKVDALKIKDGGSTETPKPELQSSDDTAYKPRPERIRNKDRPSIQIYRPGMLKKRTPSSGDGSGAAGAKTAAPDSASTSASSSPTPPTSKASEVEGERKKVLVKKSNVSTAGSSKSSSKPIASFKDSDSVDKSSSKPTASFKDSDSVDKVDDAEDEQQ